MVAVRPDTKPKKFQEEATTIRQGHLLGQKFSLSVSGGIWPGPQASVYIFMYVFFPLIVAER